MHPQRVEPCGQDLLVLGHDEQGRGVAALLELPSFEELARYLPVDDPEVGAEHRAAICRLDGSVDLLVQSWSERSELQLHRDVFGELSTLPLPPSESAAFVGDRLALLETPADGQGPLTVALFDPATGDRSDILEHRADGYEITVAPDGRHALVRGYDDGPLLVVVDIASGEVVSESPGWWQPTQRPWVRADRILQVDEDSGGMDGTGVSQYRFCGSCDSPVGAGTTRM